MNCHGKEYSSTGRSTVVFIVVRTINNGMAGGRCGLLCPCWWPLLLADERGGVAHGLLRHITSCEQPRERRATECSSERRLRVRKSQRRLQLQSWDWISAEAAQRTKATRKEVEIRQRRLFREKALPRRQHFGAATWRFVARFPSRRGQAATHRKGAR